MSPIALGVLRLAEQVNDLMVDSDSWPPVTKRHMAVLQMNVSERYPWGATASCTL